MKSYGLYQNYLPDITKITGTNTVTHLLHMHLKHAIHTGVINTSTRLKLNVNFKLTMIQVWQHAEWLSR